VFLASLRVIQRQLDQLLEVALENVVLTNPFLRLIAPLNYI